MTSLARIIVAGLIIASVSACSDDGDAETSDGDTLATPMTPNVDTLKPAPTADTATRPAEARNDTNVKTPPAPIERPIVSAGEQQRIDKWLAANADSLNDYGDPEGTMYAGGTPLFSESKGEMISKYEYIVVKHPEKPWMK